MTGRDDLVFLNGLVRPNTKSCYPWKTKMVSKEFSDFSKTFEHNLRLWHEGIQHLAFAVPESTLALHATSMDIKIYRCNYHNFKKQNRYCQLVCSCEIFTTANFLIFFTFYNCSFEKNQRCTSLMFPFERCRVDYGSWLKACTKGLFWSGNKREMRTPVNSLTCQ